jgi:hypothetical protein
MNLKLFFRKLFKISPYNWILIYRFPEFLDPSCVYYRMENWCERYVKRDMYTIQLISPVNTAYLKDPNRIVAYRILFYDENDLVRFRLYFKV